MLDDTLRLRIQSPLNPPQPCHPERVVVADESNDLHVSPVAQPAILFAGQISGVEGYTESIATGMLAGIYVSPFAFAAKSRSNRATALGSLVHYITHADVKHLQPANITFDLLPALEEEVRRKVRDKKERHRIQCERALAAFDAWRSSLNVHPSLISLG